MDPNSRYCPSQAAAHEQGRVLNIRSKDEITVKWLGHSDNGTHYYSHKDLLISPDAEELLVPYLSHDEFRRLKPRDRVAMHPNSRYAGTQAAAFEEGTVINHAKGSAIASIKWDNGHKNAYSRDDLTSTTTNTISTNKRIEEISGNFQNALQFMGEILCRI